MKEIQYFLTEIDEVAKKLLIDASSCKIIALAGPLGAGKTTLTSAMLAQLGVKDPVSSPTFTYVNIYKSSDGCMVYHFDLYRLKNLQEFEQLGFFEYLDQPNSLVFIEWPEILLPVLKEKICLLQISTMEKNQRKVIYELR